MDTTAPQTPQAEQEAPSVEQEGTGPQVEDTDILPEPEAPAVAESPPAEPDAKAE